MKKYNVDVDITMSCRIEVDAESEEQAKTIAANWIGDDPWEYVRNGHYISHEFEAGNESENDDPAQCVYDAYSEQMRKAVAYINSQLEPEDKTIICAKVDKNFKQHMNPAYGIDDGKIIDLLGEYGDDNDLPEDWWESECDLDDIVLLIQFEN